MKARATAALAQLLPPTPTRDTLPFFTDPFSFMNRRNTKKSGVQTARLTTR